MGWTFALSGFKMINETSVYPYDNYPTQVKSKAVLNSYVAVLNPLEV